MELDLRAGRRLPQRRGRRLRLWRLWRLRRCGGWCRPRARLAAGSEREIAHPVIAAAEAGDRWAGSAARRRRLRATRPSACRSRCRARATDSRARSAHQRCQLIIAARGGGWGRISRLSASAGAIKEKEQSAGLKRHFAGVTRI